MKTNDIILDILIDDYYVKLEVKKECTWEEYLSQKKRLGFTFDIPLKSIIYDNFDTLEPQKFILMELEHSKYIITTNGEKVLISRKQKNDNEIVDEMIKINLKNRIYEIDKLIHDFNYSTKSTKGYHPMDPITLDYFALDKEEAFLTVEVITDELSQIKGIEEFVDLSVIETVIFRGDVNSQSCKTYQKTLCSKGEKTNNEL